ncbi:MAG: glycerate kinase [Bacteroidales bacterium]|nr:glycerate kinase [Bacteroidales bacterium]
MKILIAPDSFKHCLTAMEVACYLEKGINKILPEGDMKILPLADGGEGTVRALVDATGGNIYSVRAHDPLMRKIESFFGVLGDNKTAIIEMAAASGIELIQPEERNPFHTTTYGTGELIKAALDRNCKKIIIGIGGSATNDGGSGMVQALGGKLLDKENKQIEKGGLGLESLVKIDISTLDTRLEKCEITVASDVENVLTGPNGATIVYGPQKGANAEMVEKLDQNLKYYANKIEEFSGKQIRNIKGSGAAGGLGAGLIAFTGAEIKPGFHVVSETVNLKRKIEWADYIITGEGKIDSQTQYGKTPYGVAKMVKKYNKIVIAIAGTLENQYEELYQKGFDLILPIIEKPMQLEEAIREAPDLLKKTGERIAWILKLIEKNK